MPLKESGMAVLIKNGEIVTADRVTGATCV